MRDGSSRENSMDEYLASTETIDSDSGPIRDTALAVTSGMRTDTDKAVALFYFVRDRIRFNPYVPAHLFEHNRASTVLDRAEGLCYQKSIVLTAMARFLGIPARLRFADIRNHQLSDKFREMMCGSNILIYHGYNELHLGGRWVSATPAYDLKMCLEHGFVPVEFDGVNDAKFHPRTSAGEPHIEYIREHGHYADLPWVEILAARDQFVAGLGMDVKDFMARWEQPDDS